MLWDFVESIKKYDLQLKRNALTQVENCNVDMITVLETTETSFFSFCAEQDGGDTEGGESNEKVKEEPHPIRGWGGDVRGRRERRR